MKEMKTLTINGVTYAVTDPTAPRIDDTVLGDAPWSAKKIVDTLCPGFTKTDSIVTCTPVAGYPLEVAADSTVTRCGKNLFDKSESKLKEVYWLINDGTESAHYYGFEFLLPPGSYVLKAYPASTYQEGYLYGTITTLDGTRIDTWHPVYGGTLTEQPKTFTDWVKIIFYDAGNKLENGAYKPSSMLLFNRFDIQVEVGNKATAYEPHIGGTFAPGDTVPALPGINTIYADAGTVTVTGRADPNAINRKTAERLAALEAALVNT